MHAGSTVPPCRLCAKRVAVLDVAPVDVLLRQSQTATAVSSHHELAASRVSQHDRSSGAVVNVDAPVVLAADDLDDLCASSPCPCGELGHRARPGHPVLVGQDHEASRWEGRLTPKTGHDGVDGLRLDPDVVELARGACGRGSANDRVPARTVAAKAAPATGAAAALAGRRRGSAARLHSACSASPSCTVDDGGELCSTCSTRPSTRRRDH